MAAIKGEKTLAELAQQHDVPANQITAWKAQLLEGAANVFGAGTAGEEAVPAVVLSAALFARYRSRVDATFGDKLLSAMRFGFGGHTEVPQ